MQTIRAVPPGDESALQRCARGLFLQYGEFLRATQACGTFDFERYAAETLDLPTKYIDHNGEVLLAFEGESPAACLAYWTFPADATGNTCEIKRLFVSPAHRNFGLARMLVAEAIERARQRAFSRIVLDTDVVNMPGALQLYRTFSFVEYGSRQGNIAFFERSL